MPEAATVHYSLGWCAAPRCAVLAIYRMTMRGTPMMTRLLVLLLCLSILSTVTGCYIAPASYGTSSSGGRTEDETRQYRAPWGRQDGEPLRSWERQHSGPNANE